METVTQIYHLLSDCIGAISFFKHCREQRATSRGRKVASRERTTYGPPPGYGPLVKKDPRDIGMAPARTTRRLDAQQTVGEMPSPDVVRADFMVPIAAFQDMVGRTRSNFSWDNSSDRNCCSSSTTLATDSNASSGGCVGHKRADKKRLVASRIRPRSPVPILQKPAARRQKNIRRNRLLCATSVLSGRSNTQGLMRDPDNWPRSAQHPPPAMKTGPRTPNGQRMHLDRGQIDTRYATRAHMLKARQQRYGRNDGPPRQQHL